MSVNEVRLKKASKAFEIRGTGSETSRTFAIGDEDHTIGNALRHVLVQNSKVGFAGYSVPHPSEPVVHIRVQTHPKEQQQSKQDVTAIDALQEACETLKEQCDIVLSKLEQKLPEVKEDRIQLEQKLKDMLQEELLDEEMGEEEDIDHHEEDVMEE